MAFYGISARGQRVASAGFGVCVGAFLIRLLSEMLAWPWLLYVVLLVRLIGILIAVCGLLFGWLDACEANGAFGPSLRVTSSRGQRSGRAVS
jgi:hypothetical protein